MNVGELLNQLAGLTPAQRHELRDQAKELGDDALQTLEETFALSEAESDGSSSFSDSVSVSSIDHVSAPY